VLDLFHERPGACGTQSPSAQGPTGCIAGELAVDAVIDRAYLSRMSAVSRIEQLRCSRDWPRPLAPELWSSSPSPLPAKPPQNPYPAGAGGTLRDSCNRIANRATGHAASSSCSRTPERHDTRKSGPVFVGLQLPENFTLRRSSADVIFTWKETSVVTTDCSFVIFVIVSGYDAPRV
jgi:hypothetical protein